MHIKRSICRIENDIMMITRLDGMDLQQVNSIFGAVQNNMLSGLIDIPIRTCAISDIF